MELPEGAVETTLSDLDIAVEYTDGDELWALCPGHHTRTGKGDRNPSWSINAETGIHYCFSCHYKGNLLTLIRDIRGIDAASRFRTEFEVHARALLADPDFDISIDKPTAEVVRTANFKPESWLDDFTDPPRWALRARRITGLGAKEYGIRWDGAREAWIFPFRDPVSGNLLGYQLKAQKTRLFRNRPRTVAKSETFFGWSVARGARKVVVVESPLDAVILSDRGVAAIAVCGSHLSEAQVELLAGGWFDLVCLWLDNDTAGELETRRLKKVLTTRGVRAEFVTPESYPEITSGKDAGDLADDTIDAVLDSLGV